jgi:protein-S-isoprenylcysteine O-methyltransferase Ste14
MIFDHVTLRGDGLYDSALRGDGIYDHHIENEQDADRICKCRHPIYYGEVLVYISTCWNFSCIALHFKFQALPKSFPFTPLFCPRYPA